MKRWWSMAVYGLGGLGLAVVMVWAGFTVAGHRLSTPAQPVQPLEASVPSAGGHATNHASNVPSRTEDPATPSTQTFTPATPNATPSVSQVSSASGHPSDDRSQGGDD